MEIDLIIIVIIALSTFLAYRKGLMNLAIGLCAFIISVVITFVLYQPISNFVINTTGIDEAIEDTIYEKANDVLQDKDNEDELTNNIMETTKNEMLSATARNLSVNLVRGGVIVVLFIAMRIALVFISAFADAVTKLPIVSQINKSGGIAYGILRGILMVYVLLLIAGISGQINPNNVINKSIDRSYLGKTMYENNILGVFFKS